MQSNNTLVTKAKEVSKVWRLCYPVSAWFLVLFVSIRLAASDWYPTHKAPALSGTVFK
jgi:hypothetical protein